MVLVLVTGAVVEEDGSAWVWGRREGRHAPWAASSAALGVAVLRGMNYYQGGGDPNSLGFVASPPEDGAFVCAPDGAVRGHRPWWAVWVWRWAVAVTFGVAALGVAVLRGMNYYQGGCDPFLALGSWRRPRRMARGRGGVGGAVTAVTAVPGAMGARMVKAAKAKAKVAAEAMAMAMAKAMAKAVASWRRRVWTVASGRLVWERADAVSRGRRLIARSGLRVRSWR